MTKDADVRYQIDLLSNSDVLAIVHPNCWGGGAPPAMMKGWIDRVFAPGAAYAFAKGEDDGAAPVGILNNKQNIIVNTSNTTAEREATFFGDPHERIWRDCLLGYCGFTKISRLVFRVVATSTEPERKSWLASTRAAALELIHE